MNKEIACVLEELTDDYPRKELIRCKNCVHHEPHPDMACQDEWVYCIVYDTFKRCDGFCELGSLEEEN